MENLYNELTQEIKNAYESGVDMGTAEKLAAKFLYAQIQVAEELQASDLDARMRKTGLKAIKSAVYLSEATKGEKKPTESMLEALINKNEIVQKEQEDFDVAEVKRDKLQNFFNIFKDAHIYFRGVAKGNFQ